MNFVQSLLKFEEIESQSKTPPPPLIEVIEIRLWKNRRTKKQLVCIELILVIIEIALYWEDQYK